MNKKLLLIIALFIFSIVSFLGYSSLKTKFEKPIKQTNINVTATPSEKKVTLIIDFSDGKNLAYDSAFSGEKTAFDILKSKLEEQQIALVIQEYDFGVFIKSIGDYQGDENSFWLYSVNNEPATVGADKYVLKDKDIVQFTYTIENK